LGRSHDEIASGEWTSPKAVRLSLDAHRTHFRLRGISSFLFGRMFAGDPEIAAVRTFQIPKKSYPHALKSEYK